MHIYFGSVDGLGTMMGVHFLGRDALEVHVGGLVDVDSVGLSSKALCFDSSQSHSIPYIWVEADT
jgi:hypothetical protein